MLCEVINLAKYRMRQRTDLNFVLFPNGLSINLIENQFLNINVL